MADALTPLPVKTKTNGDVVAKIVDSAGSNIAAVDASGRVKTNLDAYGGTATTLGQKVKASSIPVAIASDQDALNVNVGAPTSPKTNQQTSTALAAAANATLNFTDITTAKTGKLMKVTVAGTVPLKVEIGTFTSSTLTVKETLYTSAANPSISFDPPSKDFITQAGGTGNNFAVKITNRDNTDAGDVAAVAYWDEV